MPRFRLFIVFFSCLAAQFSHTNIRYAPYGELLANQRSSTFDERYKFTGKERDAESGYDYYGARFLSTQLGIWTRPDPLLDKTIHMSSYMYCNGNPIKFVDPDGKEKHNKMDPNTEDINQCYLWEGASQFKDYSEDTYIYFIAHGSPNAMYPCGDEKPMTAEGFVSYLTENSDLWNNTDDKSSLTIVLVSCQTAKGKYPIAKQISKLLPETPIIAPTEVVWSFSQEDVSSILGTSEKANMNDISDPTKLGKWNTYKNGELVNTSRDGSIYNIYPKATTVKHSQSCENDF